MDFVKKIDLTDNPISDTTGLADKKYLKFEEKDSTDSDSESSDQETESDMSETSEEDNFFDEHVADALPLVARFAGTGC